MNPTLERVFRTAGALALALFAFAAQAQGTGTVTGRVIDSGSGDGLPLANVYIQDIGLGAAADIDGRFTISNVPARAEVYTVRASFVGFDELERPAQVRSGETVEILFELGSTNELEGVVVTSLGIERQSRELGYSVSEVDGDEASVGDDSNFLNALSGKIPGLDISSQSGNIGGSTRVILRGISSLEGDQQPLFVVDGVPISNANVGDGGNRISGSVDTGNRATDINPNDIQTVSVLKGGAAAALYGQRARNGVILITTKRGIQRSKTSVQVSSGVYAQDVFRLPDFQNEYAAGDVGVYNNAQLDGWGPRIQGQTVNGYPLDPETFDTDATTVGAPYVLTAEPDNVANFFSNGVSTSNSIAFSTATEKTDVRVGVTYVDNGGIIPGADLDRTSLTANLGSRLDNKITFRVSGNYVNSNSIGRVASGGNDPTVVIADVITLPRTLDIGDLENVFDADGNQRSLGNFINNPFFNVQQNPYETSLDRVYGQGTIGYDPLDWVNVTLRLGTDVYTEDRQRTFSVGTLGRAAGEFRDDIIRSNEVTVDGFATADRQITEQFSFRALAGFNVNDRRFERRFNTSQGFPVPDLFSFATATQNAPTNFESIRRLYGFFGDVTLGYNDVVFLNLTGRNDFSSTLPVENNSYFYPSANLSVVFSDLLNLPSEYLSYGKLRLNAARVGSDTDPYQLQFAFNPRTSVFGQYGTGPNFPYFGSVGFDATDVIPPQSLRPQQQDTYEAGIELSFLQERLTVDATYYNQVTSDQILQLPVPPSTGFAAQTLNIGEIKNTGVEALVNARLIDFGGFTFDSRVNFQTNNNTIQELAPDVDTYTVQSGFNEFQVRAEVGQSLGIYGRGFLRDSTSGLPVIDPNTGLRQASGEILRLGDLDPDFRIGFGNTFKYENRGLGDFQLGFLIDWRQGGEIFSGSVNQLRRDGLVEETLLNREGTFIDNGVILDPTSETGTRPNDVPVRSMEEFWGAYAEASIIEGGVFDATYVKLREVTFGYSFPERLLQASPFGRITVSLEARNLALLYSKIPHIDPETNIFGSGVIGSGYEFFNVPSTKTFGASINFSF